MLPEKPQSPFPTKALGQPAPVREEPRGQDLILANTFGLARLWRDLLGRGS